MRRIFALALAALPILAGFAIAGVKIAQADVNGTCIVAATASPVSGYPTLPACSASRYLKVQIVDALHGYPVQITPSGSLDAVTGGTGRYVLSSTTCTTLGGISTLHALWAAATETATVSIYDESSATCSAADLVWSGTLTTTPVRLDYPVHFGLVYKMSAAPATNDYLTIN